MNIRIVRGDRSSFLSPSRLVLKNFYKKLVRPKAQDEDSKRHEFILNILLLGSIVLASIAFGFVLFDVIKLDRPHELGRLIGVGTPLLIFTSLYFLSRVKLYKTAAYIFVGLYALFGTYTLVIWGVLVAQGLLTYAIVIVFAGILIGTRFAFFVTLGISLLVIILTYLQEKGIIQPDLSWRALAETGDAFVLVFTFSIIALVSWLSNREIEKSLQRARRSERALKKQRDLLEVKIEERTKQLKQAQMEKMLQLYRFAQFGRLSSGLIHEIANPLTAISLNLQKLDTKESSALLSQALEGTKGIEELILAARKQLQNQEELKLFKVKSEIEQVVRLYYQRARKSGVEITVSVPANLDLYGNPLKFHQFVANLLANAIDVYEERSEASERRIDITAHKSKETVVLEIQDNAGGVPSAILEHIFEPFFTTKHSDRGMGIGLTLCKDIVEKEFFGSVSVRSTTAGATIFTVRLPFERPS